MRVVKIAELKEEPMGEATPIAGWTGEPLAGHGRPSFPMGIPTTAAQCRQLQAGGHDRMACPYVRSDPGRHAAQRHRRHGA